MYFSYRLLVNQDQVLFFDFLSHFPHKISTGFLSFGFVERFFEDFFGMLTVASDSASELAIPAHIVCELMWIFVNKSE